MIPKIRYIVKYYERFYNDFEKERKKLFEFRRYIRNRFYLSKRCDKIIEEKTIFI